MKRKPRKLTNAEAMRRLFPKAARDAIRREAGKDKAGRKSKGKVHAR